MMRQWLATAFLIGLFACLGCDPAPQPQARPIERMWEQPVISAPQPGADASAPYPVAAAPAGAATTSAPGDEAAVRVAAAAEILAYVNGQAITRGQAGEELIRTHGLSYMQQMVLLIAARERASQMGLTIVPADIQAAHEAALRRIATPIGAPDDLPLDRAVAERLLTEFLLAKNISRAEWDRRMEQQAHLRAIATAELERTTITEQMLREEYALAYGERVQIRHIQVSSLDAHQQARDLISAGRDFELVARQLSENQITSVRGGLMPPFTRNDPSITPLIRETAFGLSVGETSAAVHENNWYHIIRLERRFPASGVGFDHVDKKALESQLKARLTAQRISELERELFNQARVDIRDPGLSEQFNRQRESIER